MPTANMCETQHGHSKEKICSKGQGTERKKDSETNTVNQSAEGRITGIQDSAND